MTQDISLDALIRRNLHEESPLNDVIAEACQIYAPGGDEALRASVEASVLSAIADGARHGRIEFYRYVAGGTSPATLQDALSDRINVFLVTGRRPMTS